MKRHTIGPLQKKVLTYLVKHPDKHIKGIQTGLENQNKLKRVRFDYHPVNSAVHSLERSQLLETIKNVKVKGNTIPLWRLSEIGIITLLMDPEVDYTSLETLSNNYPHSQIPKIFKIIEKFFGRDAMNKNREFISKIQLNMLKQVKEKILTKKDMMNVVFSSIFTYYCQLFKDMSIEEWVKFADAFVEEGLLDVEIPATIRKLLT